MMTFQVSPGVNISEIDLTTSTSSVATTDGAIAGLFNWGPVGKVTLIDSENTLVTKYGRPTNDNYETFFSAANFLSYANRLYVSRAGATSGFSNTMSTALNGNTTAVIASNTTGISVGDGAYGSGLGTNVIVSNVSTNTTHTIVTLSSAALLGNSTVASTQNINFFDTDYSFNAVANSATAVSRANYIVKNSDHFETVTIPSGVEFVAKYPGDFGNSIRVSVCANEDQYASTINPYAVEGYTNTTVIPSTGGITLNVNETTANVFISNSATLNFSLTYQAAGAMRDSISVGDIIEVGNNTIGKQTLKIKTVGALSNTNPLSPTGQVYFNLEFEQPYAKSTNWTANTVSRKWEFSNLVATPPSISAFADSKGVAITDEMNIVVVDDLGKFTGTSGTVLEVYQGVSRGTDAKNSDGTSNYYRTILNNNSRYVWATNDISGAAVANTESLVAASGSVPFNERFVGGRDGASEGAPVFSAVANAIDLFRDTSSLDISLLITGKAAGLNGTQTANYLIDNVAEYRKDCVVFASPRRADVVDTQDPLDRILDFRSTLRSSSYALLDSGYKYQYDKYNDVYRYVPLNGDIAGLAARTDNVRDPWWSPAGFNRGQIKNVIKLAWNPNQTERDALYPKDINPVATFAGQGTILFGDKTTLGRPSAFNRINVRRLFIVLEKTVALAGRNMLFEFNDEFTRAQFKNLVEPFLRDVQSRRGIIDFKVVCDESNNTSDVIDSNRFVGDIYIKPNKSINFVQLNFVAVGSGVEFSEIVGQF